MANIIFSRGKNINMTNLEPEDGQIIFTTDTHEIFMDYNEGTSIERFKMESGIGKDAGNHAEIFNDYSMNKATGAYSHAEGQETEAAGSHSHVSGYRTTAYYDNQFVCGKLNNNKEGTVFEVGNGYTNASEGIVQSNAFEVYKDGHAEIATMGETDNSLVTKQYVDGKIGIGQQTAEGGEIFNDYVNNEASGKYSHAEGYYNIASGYAAHAEGGGSQIDPNMATGSYSHAEGEGTQASGNGSHSEGQYTKAQGTSSHAEGWGTEASGTYSHAEGRATTAIGKYSHAEGSYTQASGDVSHASGHKTTAGYQNQFVCGCWNDNKSGTLFEVGNGDDMEEICSNAFEVYFDGHAEVQKMGDSDNSVATKQYVDSVAGSSSGGSGVGKTDQNGTGEIFNNYTNNIASGPYSHAEGSGTQAKSFASHAEGASTAANAPYSHASGNSTIAGQPNQFVCGIYNNNKTDTIFEIGNGAALNNRSNAFEVYTDGSIAIGGVKITPDQLTALLNLLNQ